MTTTLADAFETNRNHLKNVAFRMLGSLAEADDAVQEAWLHVSRSGADGVDNLGGWLTTVVARVCLDVLRARRARREEPEEAGASKAKTLRATAPDAEQETAMAEAVGLAMLVVLDTLSPAERLAFVLHEVFGVPFEQIAPIVNRSPEAARQLASRARRLVRGAPAADEAELARQRRTVERFLAALRAGDVDALVAVLDPEVVVHAEGAAGGTRDIRGARAWASGAVAYAAAVRGAQIMLVDGAVGLVMPRDGRLWRALRFRFAGDTIVAADVLAEAASLAAVEIALLEG